MRYVVLVLSVFFMFACNDNNISIEEESKTPKKKELRVSKVVEKRDLGDASYLYQDEEIFTTIKDSSVKVLRKKDKKVLIDTKNQLLYKDKSSGALDISYKIIKQIGGFDVVYTVVNKTKKTQLMPDFQLPNIGLKNGRYLDILNTNTIQYMQKRDLKAFKKNYFTISSFSQIDKKGKRLEEQMHYASDTLSPYSPVICAKDGDFAIGSSLNYPFLRYEDKTPRSRGEHQVLMNKLYPKMRLYKDAKVWRLSYSFDEDGVLVGRIGAGKKYVFTLPIRFSKPKNWLFTLHPYKEYFSKLYKKEKSYTKDVSPILLISFSFYGDNVTSKSPRGWSWLFENTDEDGYSSLPLKQVVQGLSLVMDKKGYKRVLLSTLSGVYEADENSELFDELPFQFISNFQPDMQKELKESLAIFKKAKQDIGFWWGIAGMMPVDKKGEVISFDKWKPHSDTPFLLDNPSHSRYAKRQLDISKALGVDSISLDAFVRMQERDRVLWLDIMKRYAPDIKFALEQQVDFMHTQAPIIIQPENYAFDDIDYSKSVLTQPAIFAHYLNPNAEIQVLLEYSAYMKNQSYIKKLVKWGYTPIIVFPSSEKFDHDEKNVTKRIVDNVDVLLSVKGLDNSKIAACFDGIDNDNDGKVDWPYDSGCLSATDESE